MLTTSKETVLETSTINRSSGSSIISSSSSGSISSFTVTSHEQTLPTTYYTTGASTTSAKKSSSDTLRIHQTLRSALAIYTVTFTLFLIPIPSISPLELLIITTTSITGWILLYLDAVLAFLHNPKSQFTIWTDSFQVGVVNYTMERWHTFQLIRRRNTLSNKDHTRLHYVPPNTVPSTKFRLGAWWKTDIFSNLKRNNLRQYFNNPNDFSLEKYSGVGTTTKRAGHHRHHEKDDIFSSDEDLDTSPLFQPKKLNNLHQESPLATKLSHFKLPNCHHAEPTLPTSTPPATTPPVGGDLKDVAEESKETCVEEGTLSRREKVSGFIAWEALKRESAGSDSNIANNNYNNGGGMERVDTEASGSSWEREVMGAAI